MKHTIAFSLLASIVVLCASCGNETNSPVETESTVSEATTTTEDRIEASLPEKDFGGTEIHILSYAPFYGVRDEFLYSDLTGDVIDDALYNRNLMTEQRLGVKLVYDDTLTDKEAPTKFQNSVISGDDTYDTFAFKTVALGSLFTSGVIRNWEDIKGLDYSMPWYVKDANDTFTIGGKHFSVFSDALATNMTCTWAYVYNKRVAEDWGISDIYDIVMDGKWTVDKLSELTKNIYTDVNGNGKTDKDDIYGLYLDCGGRWTRS